MIFFVYFSGQDDGPTTNEVDVNGVSLLALNPSAVKMFGSEHF